MSTSSKAEIAAEQIQSILDSYHQSNSQNVRYRSEVETLKSKLRSVETLLGEKEQRLVLLTELLTRRREQPRLPEPALIEAEATNETDH